MVEEVEELKPQLQIPPLGYMGVFVSREIALSETRLAELLSFLIAICPWCWRGELSRSEDAVEISAP